jgi:acyl carrier protein
MDQLLELQDVFRRVFDDDDLIINGETSAVDIEGWDSIAFVNLIIAVEKHFKVRFAASEIGTLGKPGQNIAAMLALLKAKTGGAKSQ